VSPDQGTALAEDEGTMPIATTTPPSTIESLDAPPPAAVEDEGAVREAAPHVEPLDATDQYPYDNVACTD
jgi:hypothetical protein